MTRYGVLAIVAGLIAVAIGRAFGVVELFVIGAAFIGSVVVAALYVLARTPRVTGRRVVRPRVLVAGDGAARRLELGAWASRS